VGTKEKSSSLILCVRRVLRVKDLFAVDSSMIGVIKEAKMKTKLVLFAFLALTLLLLSGCDLDLTNRPTETPEPSPTPTPTETPTNTPTLTEIPTPTPTPEPAWMTTIKIQDPEGQFFKIENGQPVIDLYDTQTAESIILNQETIKIMATTDGLNPNILTAKDADDNQYAFNPDFGWFKVPEVQMDYTKLAEYTEVEQSFIEDGRANIVTALKYAENPTISPKAITPHYWANYEWFKNVLYVGLYPSADGGDAYLQWGDLALSHFDPSKPESIPFAWSGFFTTHLPSEEKIYINGRTLKNPTEKSPDQTINLFYGWDQKIYEIAATDNVSGGRTSLQTLFDGANNSKGDFVIDLFPPKTLPDGTPFDYQLPPGNPIVNSLQKRGEMMALFPEEDQNMIWKAVLSGLRRREGKYTEGVDSWSTPLTSLPEALAKKIIRADYK